MIAGRVAAWARPALRRGIAALLAMLAALMGVGVAMATPAQAHAALIRTTPADGSIVQRAPSEVTLEFGEPVGIGLGSVRVVDSDGRRVDRGAVTQADGNRLVRAELRAGLADGTYLVQWRVVSSDSHPVSGAFTFSIGEPSDISGYEGRIAAPRAPSWWLGVTRFAGFAALLVLLGSALFCLVLWPNGFARPVMRGLAAGAALVEALAAGFAVALQGPYTAGLGAGHLFDSRLLSAVLDTRYGQVTTVRIALAEVAVFVAVAVFRSRPRVVAMLLALLGAGCAVTWAVAGHGGAGEWQPLSAIVDSVHLAAVAAWIGGLTVLALMAGRRWNTAERDAVLPRWSGFATTAVTTLVLTGTYATYRETRSLDALTATRYGHLLIIKIALVGLMLVLALIGRTYLRRQYGSTSSHSAFQSVRLVRPVLFEASVAVVVVAVTAVLVQTPPARTSFAPPYTGISSAGPYRVQVDLYPARKGANEFHFYTLGPSGRTADVDEISGTLRRGTDVITVTPYRKSLGHYQDLSVLIPATGTWTLTLEIRHGRFDIYPTTQTISIK
jgi:copper transport protein